MYLKPTDSSMKRKSIGHEATILGDPKGLSEE
jgi:hypothetical protein